MNGYAQPSRRRGAGKMLGLALLAAGAIADAALVEATGAEGTHYFGARLVVRSGIDDRLGEPVGGVAGDGARRPAVAVAGGAGSRGGRG